MRLAVNQHLLRLGHGGFNSFTVSLDLLKKKCLLTDKRIEGGKNP